MFWVYVLHCADGKYYTGHSDDLERRIAQHQTGGFCDFTSRRRPVRLKWCEGFSTRIDSLEAERRIKPWSRVKKEALFRGDWAAISHFAKPPKKRPSTTPLWVEFIPSEVEGLGTNVTLVSESESPKQNPFVSSEVETGFPRQADDKI